ncbi:MAG: amidohydrolase, partial [Acidobacteria bacterium]|nr:amidohydrolase [Acidobacteriota bacterium]
MSSRGLVAAFTVSLVLPAWQPQPVEPADLVLVNGKVLTVDPDDAVAEAIAVTGGMITAVGSTEQIKLRVGDRTRVIDLNGRT